MNQPYPGQELALFRDAVNWKQYFAEVLRPHVNGRVLDVGCGNGVNAPYLIHAGVKAYTYLEPDAALLAQVVDHALPALLREGERIHGTTADITHRQFDTVLYLDVLEHIADDAAELRRASQLLAPGGRLVVLAPAFQALYSPFDAAIGHHRRYTKRSLAAVVPPGLHVDQLRYLDSLGLLLSLGNRLLMRQAMPTREQVLFWDRRVVPRSRWTDRLLGRWLGRSVVGVFRR